ncbi:phosphoserine phosphatase SerB [Thalassotalea maritima]|uniref:phosphoserine phosphatase SerB n=1 Tax=Thalassotalea maritima TaxID=3242416 RepID=UPI00352986B9
MENLSLKLVQAATIEQLFDGITALPHSFTVEEDALTTTKSATSSVTELVLFSDTPAMQLQQILSLIDCHEITLSAINHRSGRSSYRFQVADQCIQYKDIINDLALEHKFEVALLSHAPTLAEPGLLVMDMDSTTIQIECIDEIAKLAGVGEMVSAVTERAMQGELDFAESLKARVAALAGADEAILAQVARDIPLMHGLLPLIEELKQHGWRVAVASGGFTYFTEILKQQLDLDATQANVLEIEQGKLTGKVLGDITDAKVKADTLVKLAKQYQIPNVQTVAMGDGANDLQMMQAAHLGVAFEAKPIVLKQASAAINITGLDTLLHYLK